MGQSLEDLVKNLVGDNGMARKRAREALVLAGEPAAEVVRPLLESSQKRTRWEATKTLAMMGDTASLDAFVRLLGDRQSDIRWLAGDGLITLGPRSVGPVLRSLLGGSLSLGRMESAHRVLGQLAANNDVLAGIVAPVIGALNIDSADHAVIAAKAEQALSDLDRTTGRLPAL